MADVLLPLYILSLVSSVISAILALYAIRFTRRTEERLKSNFTKMRGMMDLQIQKSEALLKGMEKEAEDIRGSVQKTRVELLDSIENVHTIRDEILESMQDIEDSCQKDEGN